MDGPPVLLVLEDLHWADELSLWVLARLLPGLAGQPLAALATCRVRGAPPVLEQLRPADVVDLVGLDATEVAELVAHLHPADALDPAELVERTAAARC
jgi:predicted ATPase